MTKLWVDNAIDLPLELEFLGHKLSIELDMDLFIFAFYRHIDVLGGLTSSHRYVLMGLEFTSLDTNKKMS